MSVAASLQELLLFQRRFDRGAAFRRFQRSRLTFLNDLAVTLKAGAQLTAAIIESARRCEDPLQRVVYQDIRERLSNGEKLSRAMGSWFADSERMLLEAFLEGARTNEGIGEALQNMARVIDPYEQVAAARRQLARMALIRAVVAIFAVTVTSVSLVYLRSAVPASRWPGWILNLANIIQAIAPVWWLIPAALIAVVTLGIVLLKRWTGTTRRRRDKDTPGLKLYREIHGSLVMIALGAYTAAGRGVGESCRLLAANASPWLRSYLGLIQHRAHKEKGAEIVDVGLFEWRQMVRLVCLSAGVGLPEALRAVGLDASDVVARQLMQRLRQTDAALLAAQKAIVFTCVFVIVTMYFAMIGMAVSVSR